MATVYFARWVLLPDCTILDNGAVAVDGTTIEAVGRRGAVRRSRTDRMVNLGELLLMPGLINLHTHLEEGVLRGTLDLEEPYAARFAKKNARLRQADRRSVVTAVRLGVRELLTNGVTTVLDTSRLGYSAGVLAEEPVRAWVHHEVQPGPAEEEDACVASLADRLRQAPAAVGTAVGPHALFSLSPRGHRRTIDLAREAGSRWACHIAESADELQAFSEQTGDLHFHLTRRRPWPYGDNPGGPMHYAVTGNMVPNGGICFHCNYATGNDLALLAVKQVHVVVCSRYSDEVRHKPLSLDLALRRGIRVSIGTESAAESPGLSVFDELYLLRRQNPDLPPGDLLAMATRNPAAALGMAGKLGALAPGHFADMIGVHVPHDPQGDLLSELLSEEPTVGFVMVNGEEVIVDA